MLNQALKSENWPSKKSMFAITPGGFINARMPKYDGNRGWGSRPEDFQALVPTAQKAVDRVITAKMKRELGLRAQFLTLGVDLMPPEQAKGTVGIGTHAELVAVIDLSTGHICHWTGKSYPTSGQENTLVHETRLKSHCWQSEHRTLILGCHDLNVFSERAKANATRNARVKRREELDELACQFKPALVLHHPHQTDTPRIWQMGWSGIRQRWSSTPTYASGIAYFRWDNSRCCPLKPRKPLDSVLRRTKCGAVANICVNGY